jgi:DNA-binding CsgD family transcriptional regulator/energy-coupling factor transporter ATP-binding protein EcfA2
MVDGAAPGLIGRSVEQRQLEDLFAAVRARAGGSLLVVGEPGIGKSALLDHLASMSVSAGTRVLRVEGIQSEMELAFAGVHQLLGAQVALVDRLPEPQRAAVRVVLGLEAGEPPNRLMVVLGVLGLLLELSTDQPVICVLDDVQWLDQESTQTLSSVARRLATTAIGMVFAAREPVPELDGLPRLALRGLAPSDARVLLDASLRAPLDEEVRRQLVAETAGNPLALVELPRAVSPAELAGGFALPRAAPLSERIEESYRRRVAELPDPARLFLLLAAADPVGDPALVRAAAACLGLGPQAIGRAVESKLLEVGLRVGFTHPLARSAIYRSAPAASLRKVHLALADVTDAERDPDRRAWHRSQAVVGPDETTAAMLEASAKRARSRGGVAAAAAFLERAATLTPPTATRLERLITAAETARDAGDLEGALALLDAVDDGAPSTGQAARATLLRGHIAMGRTRGADAVRLLLDAAVLLGQAGMSGVHEAVRDAVVAATWATATSDQARWLGLDHAQIDEVGEQMSLVRSSVAILDHPELDVNGSSTDMLIEGLRTRSLEGAPAATPILRRALDATVAAVDAGDDADSTPAVFWSAIPLSDELWDEAAGLVLFRHHEAVARRDGALGVLHSTYRFHIRHLVFARDVEAAKRALAEGEALAEATGGGSYGSARILVAAWAGDYATVRRLADDIRRRDVGMFGPYPRIGVRVAEAVMGNALGEFGAALSAAGPLFRADWFSLAPAVVPEFIDAASRAGALADLREAEGWMAERARATDTPWSQGMAERVRALTRDGEEARVHYDRSLDHLSQMEGRTELARTHLLYGEWLRRRGSRGDARDHLRAAHELFETGGARGFADRAVRELRALGDRPRAEQDSRGGVLTAQEMQIAEFAAEGLTNPQIAARLFLSPRTVQYHLRKAYTKLGITSRVQLDDALERTGPPR